MAASMYALPSMHASGLNLGDQRTEFRFVCVGKENSVVREQWMPKEYSVHMVEFCVFLRQAR